MTKIVNKSSTKQNKVDKSTNIKERILQITDFKKVSKEKFFASIGMTYGNFKGKSKFTPINSNAIADILSIYPEISTKWLLAGEGEMIEEEKTAVLKNEKKENNYIPLISFEAMQKFINPDFPVEDDDILETYRIPEMQGKGVKYLIKTPGSSMYPEYSNGDLLACRPISDLSFFQWGKVYVLDTNQGVIIKRLFACADDNDSLECFSDNKDYPSFRIPKSSIKAVAIIMGAIRME